MRNSTLAPDPSASLAVALLLFFAGPVAAELVIMTDGHYLRVESFTITDARIELALPSGGSLELSLLRVERILDDAPEPGPPLPDVPLFDPRASGELLPVTTPYASLISKYAKERSINPRLLAAVIAAESAFDADAVSHRGANGLMQLMPATAARFGLELDDILDPARNIDVGCRYLAWLLDRFEGRMELALAGYNAGEGTVDRYRGIPPFRETRMYLRRIYRSLGLELDPIEEPRATNSVPSEEK